MPPRHIYRGELARPLKPGETTLSKLPLLRTDLDATSDEDAVCKMMVRHIIGHSVPGIGYPIQVRGRPVSGPPPRLRLPALYAHLGVADDTSALIELAIRHVPGFRELNVKRRGGRPKSIPTESDGAPPGNEIEKVRREKAFLAHLQEEYLEACHAYPDKSKKEIAYDVMDRFTDNGNPFWLMERCKPAKLKRDEEQWNAFMRKFAKLLGV